ncbi:MAG: hypothetical protein IH623_23375 [Verrucomicrobia bacterium]|nr:hypothetical protein [Verrucomicrobiota bacterium]
MNPRTVRMSSRHLTLTCGWHLAMWLLFLHVALTSAQTRASTNVVTSPVVTAGVVTANSPWERIVMVGASVTSGFTESEPLGGPTTSQLRLSRYVDAALLVPHEPVKNLGNTFFFLRPQLIAQNQMDQARKHQPTLIIGLDFLFWFLYGEGNTDEDRLKRFDQGLKLLDAVECPIVLGDIPDASAAVNGMLRPEQIPSAAAMTAANRQLKEWAATRPQVIIVKLSEFMRDALANRAIKIRDYTLPAGRTRVLLQEDKLHASPQGCAMLALAVLDAVQATRPGNVTKDFRRDPKDIHQQVMKSLKDAAGSTPKADTPKAPGPKSSASE